MLEQWLPGGDEICVIRYVLNRLFPMHKLSRVLAFLTVLVSLLRTSDSEELCDPHVMDEMRVMKTVLELANRQNRHKTPSHQLVEF